MLISLLCVPLALTALAGCGESGDGPDGGTTPAAEGDVTFTAMSETAALDAYAKNALEKEIDYLLKLDQSKLLYNFYANAGLDAPNGATRYGGWENSLIAGHTMGHYLSALAQAYANGGTSEESRTKLDKRIKQLVLSLKTCQDAADNSTKGAKPGFLWGANAINPTNVEFQFDNIEQGKANINTEAWVPWYTMHKILAGLIDVYTLAGNETALGVAKKLGDWVCERVMKWDAATRKTVLSIEYGGMNDAMYNLYAVTGEEKYALAAHQFDEDIPTQGTFSQTSLVDRILSDDANYLQGQHANTTIPKVIGLLNGYLQTKDKTIAGITSETGGRRSAKVYLQAAEKFWTRVVEHHTYVTGGNSNDEHFQADDSQWAIRSNVNCETCNVYNMLKLSRMLFSVTKDKKYLDYYENAYINDILSSQNPETGMTTYFQPMAPGYFKVYSSEFNHFWCCTGSGMESMSKLNDSIYYDAEGATYVAMYLSSTYKTDKVSLTMTADLEKSDTVTIVANEGTTVLKLRRPDWTTKFAVKRNGEAVSVAADADFASVEVKKGDSVTVELGKDVTIHTLPNAAGVYAFKYGPFVLSEQRGTEDMTTVSHGVQVLKPAAAKGATSYQTTKDDLADFRKNINTYMTRNEDGTFTLTGVDGGPLTYVIHYKQYTNRYAVYLTFRGEDNGTEADAPALETEEIEAVIQPGRGQYEGNGYLEDNGSVGSDGVGRYATAGGSFSYWVGVDKTAPECNHIVTQFAKADNGKTISMKVNGVSVFEKTLNYAGDTDLYDVYIPIPSSVVSAAAENALGDPAVSMARVKVTVSAGKAGEASAALHTYFKTVKIADKAHDGSLAYFVDCGDYDVNTLSSGDKYGLCNSVTEQVYGMDPLTGRMWGLVDSHAADIAGPCPNGIGTNSTWAYEFAAGDGIPKTDSNRYTKNQTENNVARNLHYKFELADGTYTVKMYFEDPWNVSNSPNVSANGMSKIQGGAVKQELSFTVTVTNGELTLDITSGSACINLCYIKILYA